MLQIQRAAAAVLVLALLSGCATNYINASGTTNPPPAAAWSDYQRFEITPIEIAPAYAGHNANQRATERIQEHLDRRVQPMLASWNTRGNGQDGQRALRFEPVIEDIKFIGGGTRFFAGAMAGSSAVKMRLSVIDVETGERIAHPEFYQHANAWGGAYSIGSTDNAMLDRIASVVADYIAANYAAPVGGPTGAGG